MLKQNQLNLIEHLVKFRTLDYPSCLALLDTEKTGDRTAMSYLFRPLTKNKYIARNGDNVTVLAKGRELFPEAHPLITIGGGESGVKRANTVSKVAAMLSAVDIDIVSSPEQTDNFCFIPSACWRKIRTNILSTARFTGMLFVRKKRLAVYDIGDGNVEWQLRAERSLFYNIYHERFCSHATGMLFICDNDKRTEIAEFVIRRAMQRRKRLIEHESFYERTRPVKYSKSPIQIANYYNQVYLTTPNTLVDTIKKISTEEEYISQICGDDEICEEHKFGDFRKYPYRFFVNPASDLLKYIYFFTAVKSDLACEDKPQYGIYLPKDDYPILNMYQEVINAEGVKIYEC